MKKKTYLICIILVAVLSVLPLFALSMYDHPSADDFSVGRETYHDWQENASVISLVKTAFRTTVRFWHNWQGLYSCQFVVAFMPAIFGEQYYVITGILMILILFAGNLFLGIAVVHGGLSGSKLTGAAIGCTMSFLMVQWMPSFVEGIYWFTGAMTYVFYFSLIEILIGIVPLYCRAQTKKKRGIWLFWMSFLGFFIAGGNYVPAFMTILFLVGVVSCGIFFQKLKKLRWQAIPLAVTVFGFLLNALSPGTRVRQEHFETSGVFVTIKEAILSGIGYINSWIRIPPIVCVMILLPFIYHIVRKFRERSGFTFPCPFIVFILSVGWICAMFCPPLYAMGNSGAGRLLNIVYFSFITLVFVNVFYLCGWLQEHIIRPEEKEEGEAFSIPWVLTAGCLFVGLILASGKEAGAYFAAGLIRSGAAETYSNEAYARHEAYVSGEGTAVLVEPYSVLPPLLYFDDVTENKKDWQNRAVKRYYDLKSVCVKGEDQ